MTLSTACAAAIETGLPPKVLKYGILSLKAARTSLLAKSPDTGTPLPIGLPVVMISGTTLWRPKPQKESPVRAKPGCTSSAIKIPPLACTTSTAFCKNPTGLGITPSEENIESAKKPANLMPFAFISSICC
ncbi:hypothetical protein D3C73_1269610 [compost metagenome]